MRSSRCCLWMTSSCWLLGSLFIYIFIYLYHNISYINIEIKYRSINILNQLPARTQQPKADSSFTTPRIPKQNDNTTSTKLYLLYQRLTTWFQIRMAIKAERYKQTPFALSSKPPKTKWLTIAKKNQPWSTTITNNQRADMNENGSKNCIHCSSIRFRKRTSFTSPFFLTCFFVENLC